MARDVEAELDKKIAAAEAAAKKAAGSSSDIEAEIDKKIAAAEAKIAGAAPSGGGKGLLGSIVSVLSAPQQAAFKAVKGVRQIGTGNITGGLSSIARGAGDLGDVLTLGQSEMGGRDIEFTDAVGAKKLPRFMEGTAQLVADPLNFVTFGAGTVAKQGAKTAAKTLSKEAAGRLAKGGLKALSEAEQAAVKETLLKAASKAKNPEKTAAKQMKAMANRGAGGVTFRAPGVSKTLLSGDKAAAIGAKGGKYGLTGLRNRALDTAPAHFVGDALVAGHEMGRKLGKDLADNVLSRQSARASRASGDISDLTLRLRSALDDFEAAGPKGTKFTAEDDAFVHAALESGDLEAAIAARPDLERIITSFDDVRRATTDEQLRSGVLDAMHDSETYLRRIRTKEADEALNRSAAPITGHGTASAKADLRQKANKARSVASESSVREINDAVQAVQRGEEIVPGTLRDSRTVAEFQKPSAARLSRIDDEAGEIRARHLEDTKAPLDENAKLKVARLEGQAAVRKSIARHLKKLERSTKVADRQANKAVAAVRNTQDRLEHEAAAKLWRTDENRLKVLADQKERAVAALEEAGRRGQAAVEQVVRDLAQQLPPGVNLYEESAVQSLLRRGVEAAKAVSAADMISDIRGMADQHGNPVLLSAEDVRVLGGKPDEFVSFDLPGLGTFYAPKVMQEEITKFMGILGQDSAVGGFIDFLHRGNKWWKTMVTVYPATPAFSLRNARSNVFLTWADGMTPDWFARGGSFQKKVRAIKKNFAADIADLGVDKVLKRELGPDDYEIYKNAVDEGVIGAGYFDIDIQGAPKISVKGAPKDGGRLKRGVRFVAGSEGAVADTGRAFNQAIEQNARLSHYLYSIERLGDLKAAAERTNTVLFDYGRATAFEARVIKKIIPFWTFMSRVVPGQFRAIVENPARVLVPEKLSKLTSTELDDNAPEYQRRGGARISQLPFLKGMVTTPDRPLQAAIKTLEPATQLAAAVLPGSQGGLEPEHGFGQAVRSVLSQAGGFPGSQAKWLAEEAGNVDLFTGFRLTDDEARQRFLTELFPPLGRLPRVVARQVPNAVVEERRKQGQATLADIANVLGFRVEEQKKG